jgi:hypothetical protein
LARRQKGPSHSHLRGKPSRKNYPDKQKHAPAELVYNPAIVLAQKNQGHIARYH